MSEMKERARHAAWEAGGFGNVMTAGGHAAARAVCDKAADAALQAALDPEDEALVAVVSDAIEESTGSASGSWSAAISAIAALRQMAQGDTTP